MGIVFPIGSVLLEEMADNGKAFTIRDRRDSADGGLVRGIQGRPLSPGSLSWFDGLLLKRPKDYRLACMRPSSG